MPDEGVEAMLRLILLLAALIVLILAMLRVPVPKVDLLALGLALFVAAQLAVQIAA
jgi:hypothetical protein